VSTRVRVGEVEVRVQADLGTKQIKNLLRLCAGIALGLAEQTAGPELDKPPMGFTVITELEPQALAEPAPYDDEE
jgi:hypothetical protein